jgi:RND family efflux transporter MFP subunit
MRARRIALAVAAAAGIGALGWWLALPREVQVARPTRGLAVEAVYATGSVEPGVMMALSARVSGRLVERLADEGDLVAKGQLLARLDDGDLRASIEEQSARVDFARRQHGRVSALAQKGFVSNGESERSGAELRAAEAALRRLEAQRDFGRLYAPANGVIIRRDGEAGQYLQAGQALFMLACCAPLRVTADIDEEDINRVKPGQAVLLKADAAPGRVFDGTVSEITPKGDPVNRSYRVRIALDKPGALRTGMTVDVNVVVARRPNALLLPNQAIRDSRVWVVAGNRASQRSISAGSRGSLQTEVLAGLDGSESVIVAPDDALAEGQRVRPASR